MTSLSRYIGARFKKLKWDLYLYRFNFLWWFGICQYGGVWYLDLHRLLRGKRFQIAYTGRYEREGFGTVRIRLRSV